MKIAHIFSLTSVSICLCRYFTFYIPEVLKYLRAVMFPIMLVTCVGILAFAREHYTQSIAADDGNVNS